MEDGGGGCVQTSEEAIGIVQKKENGGLDWGDRGGMLELLKE